MLLAGCGASGISPVRQATGILFWHDWTGADAQLLADLIDNFHELHPEFTIIDVAMAPGDAAQQSDVAQRFADRFAEGTEPDLFLTDVRTAQELIQAGLAKELSAFGVKPGSYNSAALSTISDDGKIYALPFALSTQMLFYNKSQVTTPPLTLDDVRQLTSQPDIAMGLNTSFLEAYWGLRSFGGRSYDSAGNFRLDRGALTNWLTALTSIQGAAGFVLSNDQDYLRRQFLSNNIALYVGDAAEVGELAAVLGDRASAEALVSATEAHFGRLDILVNNASTFFATPIGTIDAAAWDDLTGSNLRGPLFLAQAAARRLATADFPGGGCVVNITDIHAERPLKGYPVYCAAKAGLLGLTRSLALELAPRVRVNALAPGAIAWPEQGDDFPEAERAAIVDHTLLKRIGSPPDIALAVRYLVLDAPYVTGQVINVDGGRTVRL